MALRQEESSMEDKPTLALWVESQIGDDAPYASNREFARAAGVSPSTVGRIIAGEFPSTRTLKRMAERLNFPIENLLSTDAPEKSVAVSRVEIVMSQLSKEDNDDILDFALRLLKRRKRD